LAVVAENDMRAFQAAASARRPAAVRLRGGTTFSLQLQPLKPAARRSLPHPALSASVGGPLAIQLNGEQEQTKLVKPQLESVMPLDALTSQSVKAGQIGRLVVPDDRTLMSRLIDWAIDR
jgi:putative peptide zinc metalloprotease protein